MQTKQIGDKVNLPVRLCKSKGESASKKRKKKGTRLAQEQKIWKMGAPEREQALAKRQQNRNKRQKQANKLMDSLQEGKLLRDPNLVAKLKSAELDEQFLHLSIYRSGAQRRLHGHGGHSEQQQE